MRKKVLALSILGLIASFSLTGCGAGWQNTKATHGGYFTNNKGDYIVLNESGGQIMDCWILDDTYVKQNTDTDGFSLVDKNGNGILVQGDSKIIRINKKTDMSKYVEYHKEKDLISYEEFYKIHKGEK